ncbi:MAG: osmoprotectant transport system permease protein [Frankiaceae bacterium]|jgi:osmoprotectant transport system permease protein|nr:osmoprotectant transport system permease protein [Frankiaceae bacterium]
MSVWQATISWLTTAAHWSGPEGITTRVIQHLTLSALSLALACAVALPLSLWLGHIGRGGFLAIAVTNVGRAVPTFALLSVFSLTALGFSNRSVVLALVLFGIPPVLTNAYTALRDVDPDVVEAARGVGMTGPQVLARVELPLALPLVVNGIRLAAVQIVATLTIAALVAGPGLGRIISQGFGTHNNGETVAGALLVVALAVVVEGLFALAQRRLRPSQENRNKPSGILVADPS